MEEEFNMFYGAHPITFQRAKSLRYRMTDSEKRLWEALRKKQLGGYRFRRQHPVGQFIVDFYCHQAKLVIEVDGGYHDGKDQQIRDAFRASEFKRFGLQELRFTNEEIDYNLKVVLGKILKVLESCN